MTAEKLAAWQRLVGIVVAGVGVGWAAAPGWGLALAGIAIVLDAAGIGGILKRGDRKPGGPSL